MKRKLLLALMTVCVLGVALMGSTMAAGVQETSELTNTVTTPQIGVSVQSLHNGQLTTNSPLEDVNLAAGQSFPVNYVAVNNNAAESIPSYMVITASKYWMMNSTANSGETTVDGGTANSLIGWTLGTGGSGAEGTWYVLNISDNQVVLLYSKPVAAGAYTTTAAVQNVSVPKDLRSLKDKKIGLDVTAESLQYLEGDPTANADAIATAYGVEATVAADGTITGVKGSIDTRTVKP